MTKVQIPQMTFPPDDPATVFYKDHVIHVWQTEDGWVWDAFKPDYSPLASTETKEDALAAAMWVVDNRPGDLGTT